MSTVVLHGGDLVDGRGGDTRRCVDIIVEGDAVREIIPSRPTEAYGTADEIVDGAGMLVIPGLINNHTHGTAYGPLFPSGHVALPREQVLANLDRHLLEGTTTVLCVDGFVTAADLASTDEVHPVNIGLASCNTPACLRAAAVADGGGLTEANRMFTARRAVGAGAVALGEIGAGHTLGGVGELPVHPSGGRETHRSDDHCAAGERAEDRGAGSAHRGVSVRPGRRRAGTRGRGPDRQAVGRGGARARLGHRAARVRRRSARARRGGRAGPRAGCPGPGTQRGRLDDPGRLHREDGRDADRRAFQPFEL